MLLLTLTAGANRYAVDVARVVEVIPKVELRQIPHAPAFLAGLLSYRGKVVPVLDLGLLLGVTPCQAYLSTRIILVDDAPGDHCWDQGRNTLGGETGEARATRKPEPNLLGLIAEHVSDLTYAQPEQIIPAPILLPEAPYLGAIVQTDQGIVQLIVVDQVRAASLRLYYLSQDVALDSKSKPSPLIV